jgi:hypothetical protein
MERKRGCTGSNLFQSFSKEEYKEAVFLKTIANSLLIITVKMLRENKLCHCSTNVRSKAL